MSVRRPRRTTVRSALWMVGMLIVLAGILGMHGLDAHGSAAHQGHGASGVASAPVVRAAGHAVTSAAASHAENLSSSDWSGTMSTAQICMAVLMLGLGALLRRLMKRRTLRPQWLRVRSGLLPACRGRDPDPPSLAQLSILRC